MSIETKIQILRQCKEIILKQKEAVESKSIEKPKVLVLKPIKNNN